MSGWAGFKQQGKIDEKCILGILTACAAMPAFADRISDLEARLAQLEHRVAVLESGGNTVKIDLSVQIPPCMYAALRLFRRRLRQAIGMKAWRGRKCVRRATAKLRQCFAEMRQSDAENSIDVSVGRIKKRIRSLASVSVFSARFSMHRVSDGIGVSVVFCRFVGFDDFAPEDAGQRLRR